ncbi:kinase suppressor of Ras 2-like [Portunus trituberculatus]|uniref:kinase suppressor of Ras 2-like n=1 Tax=Portunus trituberculatus TaxID=210409 RepID=UPI001E1CE3EF|nr:kinase suppressor of Ras 2-like [Portunus trituberculatus]
MTSIYFTEGGLDAHWGRSDSLVSTASSSGDSVLGSRVGSRWALLGDDDVFLPATVAIPRPCLPDLDLRCPRDEDSGSVGSCSPPPSPFTSAPSPAALPTLADTEEDPAPQFSPPPTLQVPPAHPGLTLSGLMGLPLKPLGGEGALGPPGEESLDPGVVELLGSGDERTTALRTSQRFYLRLVQWLGRKRRPGRTPRSAEHHHKVHYGLRPEVPPHDSKTARKRFADLLRRAARGGSWEEGRTLLPQQESGYSSPNISAQHTPTAHHRLVNQSSFMRRSLELSPQRTTPSTRPRMSLPADHLRRTLDGRFSTQAAERRRRLSRGKTISQDDGFPPVPPQTLTTPQEGGCGGRSTTPIVTSARRMSRPGSSSREESTGEESGFEEEEPVEVRVPPLVLEERRDSGSSTTAAAAHDPLAEWAIPWDQLRFGHVLRRGSTTNIYRGRWHGDVMIHTFDGTHGTTERRFWELVASLSMIRHENIVLFMGASMAPPNLAIVTGVRRGMSLHQHTSSRGSIPYPSRVNIARQVAQAMSYLHSRGIIHGRLNSRNVFLEAKIKLSLLDHSMAESSPVGEHTGYLAQGLLTYLPPEMMRTLQVVPPHVTVAASPTQQSDVYMYGTLLYELFAEAPPFATQHPHAVILQVGRRRQPSTEDLQCTQNLKTLIGECWDAETAQRPVFPDILRTLQQTLSLHRAHSTSEPERLNRMGVSGRISC